MRGIALAAAASLVLTGCTPATTSSPPRDPVPTARKANATLLTADGKSVGTVIVREIPGGLRVTVDARDMPPGLHGAHLHTVGKCESPGFTSAGGHWNPTGKQHGSMNSMGPHEGDLPNLMIGADGTGKLSFDIAGGNFDALIDADGAAMVIHAAPDDLKSDPSGNSGARLACGVLATS